MAEFVAALDRGGQRFPERILCENPSDYRSKAVQAYLRDSRNFGFPARLRPVLNLSERLWKFLNKQVLGNRYYETYDDFRVACNDFFNNPKRYTALI